MMVTFGNASGKPPAVEPGVLAAKGSIFLTRPSLGHYVPTKDALIGAANELFAVVSAGTSKSTSTRPIP